MLRLRGVVLAGLVVVLLGSMCGSASAAFKYSLTRYLEAAGGFGNPSSVAVDDGNGQTYVADSRSGAVDVFETATGTQLASLDPSLTPPHTFGGGQNEIAVAANNATGDVYVLDPTNKVVDVFDSAGGYLCQITGAATPSASECNSVAGSNTPAHGFAFLHGIAVDQATGEVFVVDDSNSNPAVDVFSVGGAYLRQISFAAIPIGSGSLYVSGIAVDDFNDRIYLSGEFYVPSGHNGVDVSAHVYEVDALSGAYVATWNGDNTPAGIFGRGGGLGGYLGVAADDASGSVYVTDAYHGVTDVFGPDGEYLTQITGSAINGAGTAVDQANDGVYVADYETKRVSVFGGLLIPDVTTGSASSVLPTSLTLNGVVNPDGVSLTECAFEYVSDAALREATGEGYEELLKEGFTADEIFEAQGVRGACEHPDAAEISGSSSVAVHTAVAGLQEGVTYHYRLVAENANGFNRGAVVEVTPPAPPSIDSASAENVLSGAADLRVSVNPHAGKTSYRFEYGTSTAYGTSVPAPEKSVPASLSDRTIIQHVSGLQANTTYHWRVVVRNVAGTATGVDHTFIYDTGGEALPDHRAYEMVSPPRKNGALIGVGIGDGSAPDISEDGSRVIAMSVQCFAGSGSCTALRENEGEPFGFSRTSGGWAASALAPPAPQFSGDSRVSDSATAGTALSSVATLPAGEDDLVARNADGTFVDVGPVTPPSAGALRQPAGVQATADLSHIVYTPPVKWPFDESILRGLYEYVGAGNAAPSLVGVSGGAGSTDLISVCGTTSGGALAGFGRYNSLSADGGTVFFTASACASGSGVNAGVPVPADTLYARVGGSRTVLISGRSPLGCKSAACLGSSPSNAVFQGASVDGWRVFFTSSQQLTDDASEGSGNLYEYDFSRPAGENLRAVSAGGSGGGGPQVREAVAISSDGSHIYFVAKGVLTDAANSQGQVARPGGENLYVSERDASYPQGRIAFITALPSSDEGLFIRGIERFGFSLEVANVTPDGRFLVFMSHGRLTPDDASTTGAVQVFRYDAQTGELVRISTGEHGFNDDGNTGSGDASIVPAISGFYHAGSPRPDPTMSHDGAFVFFESPVALTPRALNDVQVGTFGGRTSYAENVYEWHEGHVSLISDGKDTSALAVPVARNPTESFSYVQLLGSDATGANVFFTTTDRLVGQDTDTEMDYYDARICTAGAPCVAAPASPVLPCVGEGCRSAPGEPPSLAGPVSSSFVGVGNLAGNIGPAVKAKKKSKPTHRAHGKKKAKRRKKGKRTRRAAGKRGGQVTGSSGSTRRGR
ncbi:MAG TPA: hypothetical protein VIC06_08075 [Solirubrobacteraceae bacterium]